MSVTARRGPYGLEIIKRRVISVVLPCQIINTLSTSKPNTIRSQALLDLISRTAYPHLVYTIETRLSSSEAVS
jgi:hypothetical protein